MKILEIKEVVKYYCKKGVPPKEIHEDFMETLRKESPFYSTVKNGQQSLRGGGSVADYGHVKVLHTLVMSERMRDLRRIVSEVGIRFGTVQSILTDILGMSKVLARWVPQMLTND